MHAAQLRGYHEDALSAARPVTVRRRLCLPREPVRAGPVNERVADESRETQPRVVQAGAQRPAPRGKPVSAGVDEHDRRSARCGHLNRREDRAAPGRPEERRCEDAKLERRRVASGPGRDGEIDRRAEGEYFDVGRGDDRVDRRGGLLARDGPDGEAGRGQRLRRVGDAASGERRQRAQPDGGDADVPGKIGLCERESARVAGGDRAHLRLVLRHVEVRNPRSVDVELHLVDGTGRVDARRPAKGQPIRGDAALHVTRRRRWEAVVEQREER